MQNIRGCRTDGSALLSHQQPWHSRASRARQQDFLRLGHHSHHRPSVTPFGRLPTFTIVGLKFSLVPLLPGSNVEQCIRIMHYEIETYFVLAVRGRTRQARFPPLLPQSAPCHALVCTTDRRALPPP